MIPWDMIGKTLVGVIAFTAVIGFLAWLNDFVERVKDYRGHAYYEKNNRAQDEHIVLLDAQIRQKDRELAMLRTQSAYRGPSPTGSEEPTS